MRLKTVLIVVGLLVALAVPALTASADPISLTTYVSAMTDVTEGLNQQLPGMITAAVAVGAGVLFAAIAYRLIRRFVK